MREIAVAETDFIAVAHFHEHLEQFRREYGGDSFEHDILLPPVNFLSSGWLIRMSRIRDPGDSCLTWCDSLPCHFLLFFMTFHDTTEAFQ